MKMSKWRLVGAALAVSGVALGTGYGTSEVAASGIDESLRSVWEGETIKIIVGGSPGGSADTWVRLLAPYMVKELPGSPSFQVINRLGAGGAIAANQVYIAEPDGLTLLGDGPEFLAQLMGREGIAFDFAKFHWLGSASNQGGALMASKRSGLTIENFQSRPFSVSQQAVGDGLSLVSLAAADALGWQVKDEYGYDGTGGKLLGVQRGEVDATWASWGNWFDKAAEIEAGDWVPLATYGGVPNSSLAKGVPQVEELAAKVSPEAAALVELTTAYSQWGKPFLAPPGMKPNMVATFEEAIKRAVESPAFQEAAAKQNLEVVYVSGREITERVSRLAATPDSAIERLKEMVAAEAE